MDRKLRDPCENFASGAGGQRFQIAQRTVDEVLGGGMGRFYSLPHDRFIAQSSLIIGVTGRQQITQPLLFLIGTQSESSDQRQCQAMIA